MSADTNPFVYSSSEESEDDGIAEEEKKTEYRLLGDLPNLNPQQSKSSRRKSKQHNSSVRSSGRSSRKLRRRKQKKSNKAFSTIAPPQDGVPAKFCCALTGKIMSDPMKTAYGNHRFDRQAIEQWLQSQGNVCPVTGNPLSLVEVKADAELRMEISGWQLASAVEAASPKPTDSESFNNPDPVAACEEDLYDF